MKWSITMAEVIPDVTFPDSVIFYGEIHSALHLANRWMIDTGIPIKSLYYAFGKLTLFLQV